MPLYQNTSVDSNKLIIGNYQMFVDVLTTTATITSAYNIGAGIVNSFNHNITTYDVQAGNAPDPIEGIAEETFAVEGELIEYSVTNLSILYSGVSTPSGATYLAFGGKTQLTPLAVWLKNTTLGSSAGTAISTSTIIRVQKATVTSGLAFTAKSDNDTDPISVMAFSVLGKLNSTLTAGSQLYTITRTTGVA
jgi:hypothetical protein